MDDEGVGLHRVMIGDGGDSVWWIVEEGFGVMDTEEGDSE